MTANTIDPRLAAFRAKRIKHTSVGEAFGTLIGALQQPRPESVIVLVGPSGVGKSTLVAAAEDRLQKIHAERMARDPGFLPYLSSRAPTPLDGHFNWKDLHIRFLVNAAEVLIDRRVLPRFEMNLDGRKLDSTKGLVREELRRSLESLVRNRNVPVIMIDEASALLRLKRGSVPSLQFEILKSLAVELKIPIVLIGAYDLLGILEGTGQLLRRSQIIHLQRYRSHPSIGGVDHSFTEALGNLINAIDLPKEEGLAEHFDFFHFKSLGCIGVLKDWLDRAFVMALSDPDGRHCISRAILEATALPNGQIRRLDAEATAGELKLLEIEDTQLAKELGLDYTPSLYLRAPEIVAPEPAPTAKRRTGRAGLRGPSRDPVGVAHA
ncbi:AAA family ATPase [Aquabacterium sp. OR-4]|uniref:AAA family ATPase n=1 Tax=Aquabacterium sp. OR-4 TaxID=2978127 RepID=UPI0028C9016C|nr:TniB family NTP-binding protein [Aquabacterium sp. OR-4]MDT7836272.1 AAA family ATPase [Aquabacterium sp. OR-4]